jgi:hypothetical protein
VWMRVDACGCVWMRVDACGCVWTRVDACGRVWTRVDACGRVWMRVDACGCVWMRVDACGRVWTRVDACGRVWMRVDGGENDRCRLATNPEGWRRLAGRSRPARPPGFGPPDNPSRRDGGPGSNPFGEPDLSAPWLHRFSQKFGEKRLPLRIKSMPLKWINLSRLAAWDCAPE